MKEAEFSNKIISFSIISVFVFLLQFNLGQVENFLLMCATHIILSISLPKWIKDSRLTVKDQTLLSVISLLVISSFFYHNFVFIEAWSYLLGFWIITILIDLIGYSFKAIRAKFD